jgi:riboflavin synthase
MFTGLVEAVGEIASLEPMPPGLRMRVQTALGAELVPGDSLAVNGVCLTVVSADRTGIQADVSPETARVTTLGTARCGTIVNLERPLRADGRLGGHFVQGHVDATAAIDEIREDGDSRWMTVRFPSELASYIVRKGSIAVNGVSLTVAGVDDHRFGVQVIPYTWAHTNFHALKAGDAVNLECDVLAKYVARALGRE